VQIFISKNNGQYRQRKDIPMNNGLSFLTHCNAIRAEKTAINHANRHGKEEFQLRFSSG
jgi:hypothetical protein